MLSRIASLFAHRWFLPMLIIGNAIGLMAFHHFVSLDGPMHVLHAAVLRDAWCGIIRQAEGLWVDAGALDLNLGDLLLIALVADLSPFLLHKLLAAVAITSVCLGAWSLARSYGTQLNPVWLLVLPGSIGFVLVLGLFHFMIGTGVVFMLLAWWIRLERIRTTHLGLLAIAIVLATFSHRSGGPLLALCIAVDEAALRIVDPAAARERWSAWPPWFLPGLGVLSAVIILCVLSRVFSTAPIHPHAPHRPLYELLTLRQWLLLDSEAERWPRIALGILFIGSSVFAFRQWIRTRTLARCDALLATSLLLLLLSLIRTPKTEQLYITDRAQWVAFLLWVSWLSLRSIPRNVALAIGVCAIALHTWRVGYLERRMRDHAQRDRSALEMASRFLPDALVVPVVLDNDWLACHRTAYAALHYRGIMLTGHDHLRITWTRRPDDAVRRCLLSPWNDWQWIASHVQDGGHPHLRQIIVVGEMDSTGNPDRQRLFNTLEANYRAVASATGISLWAER